MKLFRKALVGVAVAAAMASTAQAGVMALADMNISTLGFVASIGSDTPVFSITNESRTGTAAANYNGTVATGIGAGSITGAGSVPIDVQLRCAGNCAGVVENDLTHLSPPAGANFALGDMFISGSALGGAVSGLTKANAVATGPTNSGGANATILNTGSISGTIIFGVDFTGVIVVGVDALLRTWVDPLNGPGETANAGAGYGWTFDITDSGGTSLIHFAPSELNKTFNTGNSASNKFFSFTGSLFSSEQTFNAGQTYDFAINQSSNATVRDIPEPVSLALVGVGLLGLAAASRRKSIK